MSNDDRYFQTTNFYQAVFLFAKGVELVNVDKTINARRATFVFVNCPEIEELLQAFDYGKENDPSVMVDVRKIAVATRTLKEKLYQDQF
jgi:hypothetical protein